MSLMRAVLKLDGTITEIYPNYGHKKKDESESDFLNNYFNGIKAELGIEGLDFVDMDKSQLPDMGERGKWRRDGSRKKIKVDMAIITPAEKHEKIITDLDTELEKSSPDLKKAMKLQQSLTKREYLE